jgi:hypothetical protein
MNTAKTKLFKKLINQSKKNNKKIKKTIKNKSSLKKCEHFCKNDYLVEMKKMFTKNAKQFNVEYNPTKQDYEFSYQTCKKTFCNPNCEGYDFNGDKQKQKQFQKKIKDGFQNTHATNRVDMLKKRGALSGCVDLDAYDAFHK